MVRYTAPSSVPGQAACDETTGVSDMGVLPYQSTFSTTGQTGWNMYGGNWSVNGNTLQETAGGNHGNKAVTGSTAWTNYQMSALVNGVSASSVPGIAVRVSQPASGANSYRGYLVFYDTSHGSFVIAREDYSYKQLASITVPGGIHSNAWYRITVRVTGNQLQATLAPQGGATVANLSFTDPYNSFPSGMVALRDFAGTASWQNITVNSLP
jgi:hypothetical protein